MEAGVCGNRKNERSLVGMGRVSATAYITAPTAQGYSKWDP